jgi:nitrogen fixation/metabolism regulation signal transduction histidine kinase
MTHARNGTSLLIDPRFQLKWSGYLVGVVLFVMTGLGIVIARTAAHASETAQIAVTQAEQAFEESKTNSILTKRTIELLAVDNPTLHTLMDESLEAVDAQAEKNLANVRHKQSDIQHDLRMLRSLLVGAGAALLILLSIMGIFITHRIVGPVHKMKRLLRRVSTGRLVVGEHLRRGDELEDLFDTFLQMTYSLKAMHVARLATLDNTIRRAEAANTSHDVLVGLRVLRAQMVLGVEPRRASILPPPSAQA